MPGDRFCGGRSDVFSFIDLAYLRKRDLSNGYITYIRKKTGQQLTIRWERSMQDIVDKYPENPTQYPERTVKHSATKK